jgi:hypothetical protein
MDMFFALGQYPNLRCRSLMTGTAVEITFDAASADLIPNVTLAGVNHQELNKIGGVSISNSEKEFAATIQKTFARDVQARIDKRGTILSGHVNEFAETDVSARVDRRRRRQLDRSHRTGLYGDGRIRNTSA